MGPQTPQDLVNRCPCSARRQRPGLSRSGAQASGQMGGPTVPACLAPGETKAVGTGQRAGSSGSGIRLAFAAQLCTCERSPLSRYFLICKMGIIWHLPLGVVGGVEIMPRRSPGKPWPRGRASSVPAWAWVQAEGGPEWAGVGVGISIQGVGQGSGEGASAQSPTGSQGGKAWGFLVTSSPAGSLPPASCQGPCLSSTLSSHPSLALSLAPESICLG